MAEKQWVRHGIHKKGITVQVLDNIDSPCTPAHTEQLRISTLSMDKKEFKLLQKGFIFYSLL